MDADDGEASQAFLSPPFMGAVDRSIGWGGGWGFYFILFCTISKYVRFVPVDSGNSSFSIPVSREFVKFSLSNPDFLECAFFMCVCAIPGKPIRKCDS